MNFHRYLTEANKFYLQSVEHQRYGQALMNYLHKVSPLAYKSVPEEFDPFYNDALIPDFLDFLSSNWEWLTTP